MFDQVRVARRGAAVVTLVAVMFAATACTGGQGVTVPPGYEDLTPCSPTRIPIESLERVGEPGCDLAGSSLTVDGWPEVMIPRVGEAFSQGDGTGRELMISNWGIPGVGVAEVSDRVLVDLWATTPEANVLQRQQLAIDNIIVAD